MYFMNTWEIDEAFHRHHSHPILQPATILLKRFRDVIDENSDGWAYWNAPVKAAKRLMMMIQHPETASEEEFKKAQTPIKSFCTRQNLRFPDPH